MFESTSKHIEVDRNLACATGLIWLESMRSEEKWGLSLTEVSILLGVKSSNTYKSWLKKANQNKSLKLSADTYTRLSLMAGIHQSLALSSPPGAEFDFFKRPIDHPLFDKKSAKEVLLNHSTIPYLMAIRKYFDARCF